MCIGVRQTLGACLRDKEDWVQVIKLQNQVTIGEENTGNANEEGPEEQVNSRSED
jgi:hypothetical protein